VSDLLGAIFVASMKKLKTTKIYFSDRVLAAVSKVDNVTIVQEHDIAFEIIDTKHFSMNPVIIFCALG